MARNVGIRLPTVATSYSRRMLYVVPKRRDTIAHYRNVIFQKNALRCPETSGSDCPLSQRHIPEESITLSRNVGIRLPIVTTSYSRRMHYVVPKRRDTIAHYRVIFQKKALRCSETSGSGCPLAQRHVPYKCNPQLKTSELALINVADVLRHISVPICQATRCRIPREPNFTKNCGGSCRRQNIVRPADRYTHILTQH